MSLFGLIRNYTKYNSIVCALHSFSFKFSIIVLIYFYSASLSLIQKYYDTVTHSFLGEVARIKETLCEWMEKGWMNEKNGCVTVCASASRESIISYRLVAWWMNEWMNDASTDDLSVMNLFHPFYVLCIVCLLVNAYLLILLLVYIISCWKLRHSIAIWMNSLKKMKI